MYYHRQFPTMESLTNHPEVPFEKRLLALMPHELESRILDRQKALNSNLEGDRRKNIGKEIILLESRLNLLQQDMNSPTINDIHNKQTAINKELPCLDKTKDYYWFLRKSLSIRLELLNQRAEDFRSLEPIIGILEPKSWKKEQRLGGKALPPHEWEQLSPRLLANPQTNLKENEEYEWYLDTLSEHKRKEVDSLAIQMKPIDDDVRTVVCIPTYKEGGNIYRTLTNYVGQSEAVVEGKLAKQSFDYRKLRIVVFDNYPEGAHPDQTKAEVRRFIQDHPEVPVDYIKGQFRKEVATIGHIRNMLTAAVIARSIGRKNPMGELIYISNDGDMPQNAIKSTYIADIIGEFDTHPNMDALAGKIDMPESQMAQLPIQLATRRLWQYVDIISCTKIAREPFLVGRNSAMRLKMVAAVGNYDPKDRMGEDVEIGNKIKWARSWNKQDGKYNRAMIKDGRFQNGNRVRYVSRISMNTDPRRDIFRLICGEPITTQYLQFEQHKDFRAQKTEDLIQQARDKGHHTFNRTLFELEAGQIYHSFVGEGNNQTTQGSMYTFTRAMGLLGAKWEIKNGKFKLTDTRKLESNIWLLQFRQLYQYKVEEWLGTKLRSIRPITSDNNKVLSAETADGKKLIIRTSSQKGRNKFASEKMILDLLVKFGIPVPHVIAIDSTRKIIPDRVISVVEKLDGQTLTIDYTKDVAVDSALLYQLGSTLKKIHNVEVGKGFGFLDEQGIGSYATWEDFVLSPFRPEKLKSLIDKGLVSNEDLQKIIYFFESKGNLLTSCPRKLLHGDFVLNNILQRDNKLTGIIDFENAKAGDPLWDISHFALYNLVQIGGDKGTEIILTGYGNPKLLANSETRSQYFLYILSDILSGLEWYSDPEHYKKKGVEWLNRQLKYTLQRIENSSIISDKSPEIKNQPPPISQAEIDSLLEARFERAVEWFKDFYNKGLPKDQEFTTGAKKYEEMQEVLNAALLEKDKTSKDGFFEALKADPQIRSSGFSDQELRRQIDRLILSHRSNPDKFKVMDRNNPAFRTLVYLRNRGKLERYEKEYSNLPKEINFRQIALGLARKKSDDNKVMNILDEGGTFDVALQQLNEAIQYHVPGVKVKLASIAADNMALEFADCHRYPVDHRMADVHRLNEVFGEEKRTLIISQAAYKFFWDPIGAIIQTSNALENGGWAFIGDIRDKVSYRIFEIFKDQNGNPIHPQKVFDYFNTLNLGCKFYTGIHVSTEAGESRQVMTLGIKKENDADLVLPISYERINKNDDWQSPLVYILPIK